MSNIASPISYFSYGESPRAPRLSTLKRGIRLYVYTSLTQWLTKADVSFVSETTRVAGSDYPVR